tara:strand:- start:63 stop:284 length:222 start_codon:yes stop_codon:yes gene_type:complete
MTRSNTPNAPTAAVLEVIKTFKGTEEVGGSDGWLVTFEDRGRFQNALALINMLKGWRAESHPNIKNMIQISGE